jgi:hypothetical protein
MQRFYSRQRFTFAKQFIVILSGVAIKETSLEGATRLRKEVDKTMPRLRPATTKNTPNKHERNQLQNYT